MLELVNASTGTGNVVSTTETGVVEKKKYKTVTDYLNQADEKLTDLYENIREFLMNLGDDVQEKTLRYYIAFKRFHNFACLVIQPKTHNILAYLKVDPKSIELEEGFTRDMTGIGHVAPGDLEVTLYNNEDFEKAKDLFIRSYEGS